MHLVRIGRRVINLEYLILAEDREGEGPPLLRVVLEAGNVFELFGDEAAQLRERLNRLLSPAGEPAASSPPPPPPPPPGPSAVGRHVDPGTGAPIPRLPVGQGKKRG